MTDPHGKGKGMWCRSRCLLHHDMEPIIIIIISYLYIHWILDFKYIFLLNIIISIYYCIFILYTHRLLEIVDYYNHNKSDVFVLMLDASKAFDRVRYCKLFNKLLDRYIAPVVLRILIYMYMNQTLRVPWCQTQTSSFKVCNGVKQGGVLSPILYAVYVDSLFGRLEQSGVGCHIGGHFVGALDYADDVTLVAPSRSGIRTLINVCEHFHLTMT